MNQPDRYSRFVLPSGVEQAVSYVPDSKLRTAGTFSIWLEDHTIGNLLRQQLLTNPEVVFAGYRIPHPLNPMMVVRVQTTDAIRPPQAVLTAIQQLSSEVQDLQQQLQLCAPRDPAHDPRQQQQQQQPPPGAYGGYEQYGGGYQPHPGGGYGGGGAPGGYGGGGY